MAGHMRTWRGQTVAAGFVVFGVWLLGRGVAASGAEQAVLRLNLKAGQSYKTRFTTDQKIRQTIQGTQVDMQQTMAMGYTFHVEAVDAQGAARCKVTYHSVLVRQQGPQGKMEYDSDHPPENVPDAAKTFAALVGQSFTLRITPAGRVPEVRGVDAMIAAMLKALPLPEGAERATVEGQLQEQFGDDAMKEIMEQALAIYPDRPVGVGDSWSSTIRISRGFPMVMKTTYTLKGFQEGRALVAVASNIEGNPAGKPMRMGQITLSHSLSGEQNGNMELDQASGWTVDAKMTQKLAGQVKLEGAPGTSQPMSWPISVESTVRIESPDLRAAKP